ncbi:MAG: type II 3-dehydroquinate dehydratase [Clostridia bacterium]|nr:type II 3-dehydroquinate dehydratase [Clostridia bacterium]
MKILVINGPNINMLGIREPQIYGTETYARLARDIKAHCRELGIKVALFQSNHEGKIIDKIQKAMEKFDGIVINPAAYTHTSIAIADALKAVRIPAVEIHISDISARESFRTVSYVRDACVASVIGHGTAGYMEAIDKLAEIVGKKL